MNTIITNQSLYVLRKIYNAATINDAGDVVIPESEYPEFFRDLLNHIDTLEHVLEEHTDE